MPLLQHTDQGLYCAAGDFHIDPYRKVERAIITHAHADHARWGMGTYLCAEEGREVLRQRVHEGAPIEAEPYGKARDINGVRISFHPAGHLLGSAQVRVEHKGEVWVVTGDYKTEPDRTCAPFEPVRCHTFITECTFGLPIYRWPPQQHVFDEINAWWRGNRERGWTSCLFGYSLGKAQRLISGLDPAIGPILVHGAVDRFVQVYRQAGIDLPPTQPATAEAAKEHKGRCIVVAPPSAGNSPWIRKFAPFSLAFASGWMMIRGTRRRRSLDRGFVLSDHVDWPSLLATIDATGAETIVATHGYKSALVRYLREQGRNAYALDTQFTGEDGDEEPAEAPPQGSVS